MTEKYLEQLWLLQNSIVYFAAGQLIAAIFAITQRNELVAGAVKWRPWILVGIVVAHLIYAVGIYCLGQSELVLVEFQNADVSCQMTQIRIGAIAAVFLLALSFFLMLAPSKARH
jgi:hypothetical protein